MARGVGSLSYEKPEPARRWVIDPETLGLKPEDGSTFGSFTAQELRAQTWPDCPVCGERVDPNALDVRQAHDRFPVYLLGMWECPNDCDPRPVLRPLGKIPSSA